MPAEGRTQANGGGKEQPVKRGDGGDQPGRGPGLEETPKQPAGPAAGLGPGLWGQRLAHSVDPAGTGEARRVVFTLRRETRTKLGLQETGFLETGRSW